MKKRFSGTSALDTARWAFPAVALVLCLAALWPNAAQGQEPHFYDVAVIQSATDDGGGKIRVSWTLEASTLNQAREDPGAPVKICPHWWWIEDMLNSQKWKCFTSELSGEADLVFDSGIEKIPGASAVTYAVELAVHYADRPLMPIYGAPANNPAVVKVTVNRP